MSHPAAPSATVRLGDRTKKIGSGITPLGGHSSYTRSGIPLIRSQNVHMNRFEPDGLAFISADQDAEMAATRVQTGDVLINITGASIGRVCVVPAELCPANVNQHVCIIRSDGTLDPDFLAFYFASPSFQKLVLDSQAGATRQALTKALIEDLEIPLFPLPQQRRIATSLREQLAQVEKARASLTSQIEGVYALVPAILREVLASGETKGWPRRKLSEVCDIQLGKMLSPKSKTGVRSISYLRNANVQWGRFDLRDMAEMDFSEAEESKFILVPGDLLVCEGGEPGRAAVWQGEISRCCYQKALHRLRPRNQAVSAHFVFFRLWHGSFQNEFTDSHSKTTIAHLPAIRLAELPIHTPTIEVQNKITQKLNAQLEAQRAVETRLTERLREIDSLPGRLLCQAFSGNI